MLQIATLVVLGVLVLLGAAYGYYWYSPPPQVPPLSATIRQGTVRVGDRERTILSTFQKAAAAVCSRYRSSWVGHGRRADACLHGYNSTAWLISTALWCSIQTAIDAIGTTAASTRRFRPNYKTSRHELYSHTDHPRSGRARR